METNMEVFLMNFFFVKIYSFDKMWSFLKSYICLNHVLFKMVKHRRLKGSIHNKLCVSLI